MIGPTVLELLLLSRLLQFLHLGLGKRGEVLAEYGELLLLVVLVAARAAGMERKMISELVDMF
jgi:hypothetical protein